MNCPDCQTKLKLDRRITGNIFGDLIAGELLFWALLIPFIIFFGVVGWFLFVGLIIVLLILSWRTRRYKCTSCGYKVKIKAGEANDI